MRSKLPFTDKTVNFVSVATIGAALVLLIAGIIYYVQQNKIRLATEKQTSITNELILQVRALGEENKNLNKQNRDYAYCNAMILAKYTQTRQPIVIEDLNRCILNAFSEDFTSTPQTQQNTPSSQQPSNNTNNAPSGSSNQTPNTPSNTNPTTNSTQYEQLLKVPNLLELNTPCLTLTPLVKTCK